MKIPASPERMDIREMRKRLGNDEALIADLLGLFLEDYPAQMAAIEAAVTTRRLDAVRRDAHALKGSAGNLSAFGVIAAAAALEDLAQRGDAAELDPQFAKLVLEVEQLVAELRELPPVRP
jgi:HPt (histidine-containing phosphotransfer) domain-containing protein